MDYQLHTEDEHHEDLASHLKATERDHALHVANRARYEALLQEKLPDKFRQRIEKLLEETIDRVEEHEAILKVMKAQMPMPKMKAAMVRLEAKKAE